MTRHDLAAWAAANRRDLLLAGLALLAGWQFGRVAGRFEARHQPRQIVR